MVADKVPSKKLVPAAGTPERYRLQERLNNISSRGERQRGLTPEHAARLLVIRICIVAGIASSVTNANGD